MKLSVFFDHIREASRQSGMPLEAVMRAARDAGIEGVELDYDAICGREQEVADCLRATELRVSCVYGTCGLSENPEEEKPFRIVDAAKRLGASAVLIVPGFLPEQEAGQLRRCGADYRATAAWMDVNPYVRNIRQGLCDLTAYASGRGIAVTLEDFDGATAPYATAAQLRWFLEQVPGLRLTFDTGNFAFSDEDVLAAYAALRGSIAHVHCKDRGEEPGRAGRICRGLRPVAVGDGYLPLAQIVRQLEQSGYRGYYAVEHFGLERQYEGILRSARYLAGVQGV